MVQFICQSCGYFRELDDEHRGRTAKCPSCSEVTQIGWQDDGDERDPQPGKHNIEFDAQSAVAATAAATSNTATLTSISDSLSSIADSLYVVRITCEILWIFWAIAFFGWMVIWLLT